MHLMSLRQSDDRDQGFGGDIRLGVSGNRIGKIPEPPEDLNVSRVPVGALNLPLVLQLL